MEFTLTKKQLQEAFDSAMDNIVTETGMTLNECVEKQIPKKPNRTVDDNTKCVWISCGVCSTTLFWKFPNPIKYCFECGNKIDWGNEDECL